MGCWQHIQLKQMRNLSLFIGSLLLVAALCVTFGKTNIQVVQHLVYELDFVSAAHVI